MVPRPRRSARRSSPRSPRRRTPRPDLARVQPGADLAARDRAPTSSISSAHRTPRAGPCERREEPVARRLDLLAPVPRERAPAPGASCLERVACHAASPRPAACDVESTMSVNSTVARTRSVSSGRRSVPVKNPSISATNAPASPIQ